MFGLRRTPSISAAEAATRLRAGQLELIDVRTRHEYEAVRVPGTVHLPLHEVADRLDDLAGDRPVAFLCRSGHRSAVAARRVARRRDGVWNVTGGLNAWLAAGLPHTTGAARGRRTR
jgi:rhodanese-related sulfurtransferase